MSNFGWVFLASAFLSALAFLTKQPIAGGVFAYIAVVTLIAGAVGINKTPTPKQ